MKYLVVLFGTAAITAGMAIVFNPEAIFGPLRRHYESVGMHVLAVVARAVLGIALVMCASVSKYPKAIEIIGWITLVAALILGIMGRANFRRLMGWALGVPRSFMRVGGLLAAFFGAFLAYAVL